MQEKKERVRLSQCMIVKNEEKNIRRALSWGKDIVCEQIVVDTGSTDQTVEIAREMGAKVYHFKWCDDFSAAKNYAIGKASGDWIAFLDADEYFSREDAEKLMELLVSVAEEPPHLIRCAWVQIGKDGQPFCVSVQDRIFRNLPEIRYSGRIHEQLDISETDEGPLVCMDERKTLSIMHTGYVPSVMKEKEKWTRNIQMLLREVEENPEELTSYAYLGDAYQGAGDIQKAIEAYETAITGEPGENINQYCYMNAGKSLLRLYALDPSLAESEEKVEKTAKEMGYPAVDSPDVYYYLGIYHMKEEKFRQAHDEIKRALGLLDVYSGGDGSYLAGSLGEAYAIMTSICQKIGLGAEELYYGVLALRADRYQESVLCGVLHTLKKDDPTGDRTAEAWKLLLGLYDRKSRQDLLFLTKCIKAVGYPTDNR